MSLSTKKKVMISYVVFLSDYGISPSNRKENVQKDHHLPTLDIMTFCTLCIKLNRLYPISTVDY